jgi:hypothetical protein
MIVMTGEEKRNKCPYKGLGKPISGTSEGLADLNQRFEAAI